MTDQLQAWRAGLKRGARVAVDYNGVVLVGTIQSLMGWMPDGERRWAITWDFPDPSSDEFEDSWTERYLQPVPELEPRPRRRARTRAGG